MKEYNEHVVETLDDAGCIIANKNIIIDNIQARVRELEAEVERLKVDRAKKQKESVTIFDINCELRSQLAAAQKETEQRVSACVNACAGCATEVLETAPVGFFNSTYGHPKYLEEITKQRDELLAELERFMDSHEECTDFDGFTAQVVSMDDYHKAQEAISIPDNSTEVLDKYTKPLNNQLAAQALTIKTMREALNIWINIAANCSIESGCCCCGESMKNHSHPMSCGHSPVDMADSIAYEAIAETDKALAIPDNSTEILQEWLDKQLGEPVEELDDGFYHCPCCGIVSAIHHSLHYDHDQWCQHEATWINGPLYRKPEIK